VCRVDEESAPTCFSITRYSHYPQHGGIAAGTEFKKTKQDKDSYLRYIQSILEMHCNDKYISTILF